MMHVLRTVLARTGSATLASSTAAAAAARCARGGAEPGAAAFAAAAAAGGGVIRPRGLRAGARGFAAEGGAADAATDVDSAKKEAFLEKWRKVAPSTINEPGFTEVDEEVNLPKEPMPDKMQFSLFLPHRYALPPSLPRSLARSLARSLTRSLMREHSIMYSKQEVDMVLVPGSSGDFGVKPGHVPTIAQMRPGVLTVVESEAGDGGPKERKYFVPAGFVVVHPNSSTEVSALEAVPLDDLDAETVKQGLADYTAKLASGTDEYENAVAQVGIEVYQALSAAIEQK